MARAVRCAGKASTQLPRDRTTAVIGTLIAPLTVLGLFIVAAGRMLQLQAREQTRWLTKLDARAARVVEDFYWRRRDVEVLEAKYIFWRRNGELATEFTRRAMQGDHSLRVVQ